MINVPVPEMIDKNFDSGPLRRNDNLILEFEGEAGEVAPDRGTRGGALKGWVVGVPALQAREMLQARGPGGIARANRCGAVEERAR